MIIAHFALSLHWRESLIRSCHFIIINFKQQSLCLAAYMVLEKLYDTNRNRSFICKLHLNCVVGSSTLAALEPGGYSKYFVGPQRVCVGDHSGDGTGWNVCERVSVCAAALVRELGLLQAVAVALIIITVGFRCIGDAFL